MSTEPAEILVGGLRVQIVRKGIKNLHLGPRLGVEASHWGVRRMRTRWGTSNPDSGRILLNLELAKKPVRCLEYLVVHELVHLIERHHNDRFRVLMDEHLPRWRQVRAELNAAPLAHEDWTY